MTRVHEYTSAQEASVGGDERDAMVRLISKYPIPDKEGGGKEWRNKQNMKRLEEQKPTLLDRKDFSPSERVLLQKQAKSRGDGEGPMFF